MNLKKLLTILFAVYGIVLLDLLTLNSQFLFIDDYNFWINIVIFNLVFMVVFFMLGLIITNNYQKKVNRQEKAINELKGKLYDAIKDDEVREKMMKDFEKSIK